MNIINELVSEVEDVAEDKNAYNVLISNGIDPFSSKKIDDVFRASEIASVVLKELANRIDGCDESLASLIFLQTEEGLKDLQNKARAKCASDNGKGVVFRLEQNPLQIDEHEITPEESKAIEEYLCNYKKKLDEEFEIFKSNYYSKYFERKNSKAQDALNGLADGSFRRG